MSMIRQWTDGARAVAGFLDVEATARLAERGVSILDPWSTLISGRAMLREGTMLYPCVTIEADDAGSIEIGPGATLHSGTRLSARGGSIRIGRDVEIGAEGGFTVHAGQAVKIEIGDGARLIGGGSLTLDNFIGAGAQIIGAIRAQNCRLGVGGAWRDPDPDTRGGVLKGLGIARGLDVPRGSVIEAFGHFADAPLRRQAEFHPKPVA